MNIWDSINFAGAQQKSAYDYLKEQSKSLVEATGAELNMDVERVDSYLDGNPIIPVGVSKLYVIAPKLGNFRRKLITVVEGKNGSNFPVDIYCHIDDKMDTNISEADFLNKIKEIIARQAIQASILSLFKQSKEVIESNRFTVDIVTSNGPTTISWIATPIYWSQNGSKGFVLRDIQGYPFPDPVWGKLFHISEDGNGYVYLEDTANNCIDKAVDQRTPIDNDLRTILEAIKDETVKK